MTVDVLNKGFFHDPSADPEQWVLGASDVLKGEVLQPDGDWRAFRPQTEIQTKNGFDPTSCACYGSLNMIEEVLLRKFDVRKNYSDRWLAQKTGTKEKHGNDPHYVFEYIRSKGVPAEILWPFGSDIQTYDQYYLEPDPILDEVAADFNKEFELFHWTLRDRSLIHEARKRSPLGISVHLNGQDANGYWYKDYAGNDTHWTVSDYGEEGKYHGIFDSGEPFDKKATWDKLQPELIKYIQINKRLTPAEKEKLNWLALALQAILAWIGLERLIQARNATQTPPTAPQTPTPPVPASLLWDTPQNARHSVRVICDEMGLSVAEKNLICQVIRCESGFSNKAVHQNTNDSGRVLSTDWGICQVNDFYHIGTGKKWTSVKQVLENPEKVVRWMITLYKQGLLKLWVCYKEGMYKNYLP